jgi:hypothetical protein
MEKKPKNPLSERKGPMWKNFMVTDLDMVERTSGALHARLESPEMPSERLRTLEQRKEPEAEKPDIRQENLKGREVLFKPVLSAGMLPQAAKETFPLPSMSDGLELKFSSGSPELPKTGTLMSKLRGKGRK